MEILEFYLTTLNNNLVIGKFSIIIWMFMSFPLWPFGLEVWNDRHVLWVGFGVWHNIMPKMFLFSWCKHWKAYFSFPYVQKRLKVCLCILWVKKKRKKDLHPFSVEVTLLGTHVVLHCGGENQCCYWEVKLRNNVSQLKVSIVFSMMNLWFAVSNLMIFKSAYSM